MASKSSSLAAGAQNLERRLAPWQAALGIIGLLVVLLLADLAILSLNNPAKALTPHYYLALGDSLSFGYQPDLNFTEGFVDDLFTGNNIGGNGLQQINVTNLVNYACAGESTTTMIQGGCPGGFLPKDRYTGPQLDAAVKFLKANLGRVSPITIEIGANDVLPDFNSGSCTVGPNANTDLATMDTNLQTILAQLTGALYTPTGTRPFTSDLHLLNYYNPYVKLCANSAQYVKELNDHLAADAARFRIPVVDVYGAFGGDQHMADHICDYTWICNAEFHDFHPTTQGYAVIAQAVEQVLGYPQPIPPNGLMPLGQLGPQDISRQWG